MRISRPAHSWRLTPRQAIACQVKLAQRVSQSKPAGEIRFVAGLDAAFSSDGQRCLSAVVLWDLREHAVAEQHLAGARLAFPYIPGLLSFREAPALMAALRKLKQTPDALMCDGHGWAHPRRFGIACHLGVICDLPSIGCAKSLLVGTPAFGVHALACPPITSAKSLLIGTSSALPARRGAQVPLIDKHQVIGAVLRTQTRIKPVFVSVGHKIDLRTAVQIVLTSATRYRLPEPTRRADILAAVAKRAWEQKLRLQAD